MNTGVIVLISAIVLLNIAVAAYLFFKDRKKGSQEQSNEPVEQQPTQEKERPSEEKEEATQQVISFVEKPIKDLTPIYKVGDVITDGINKYTITEVRKVCYVLDNGEYLPINEQDKWKLCEPDEDYGEAVFDELVAYFFDGKKPSEKVTRYLWGVYMSAVTQYNCTTDSLKIFVDHNFPSIVDFYSQGDEYLYDEEKLYAWLFAMVLADLMPEKRNELYQKGYDYKQKGKEIPIYGWSFDSDPNVCIMVAAQVWAMTRNDDMIPALRNELGSKTISYKQDVSELYIDICKFMPVAAGPYLMGAANRKELPVGDFSNDDKIHKYVSQYYSLDTKDKDFRQATIQAISNKEYKKPHLFGKDRTVTDPKYGTMTFHPVFGVHNIGIEIPDNGAIANLCYEVGKVCTDSRKALLDQEYGRRRPGEGEDDGTANKDPKQRVLVNYSIEEGDGHTTGYYNQGGDYVDGNGNHIGDYETYYQNQVYANSYPSGHSAFIEGVGLVLTRIMPELADKIEKAKNEFAISRCICRYHWMSDTIIGRVIGTMMVPVLEATTNFDFDTKLKKAREEYKAIKNGTYNPEPTEKINTSLAYSIGGYGSCHVDAGEKSLNHYCTKECNKERHPTISVSQRVYFTIEGAGVKAAGGKTIGVWEPGKNYELICPMVAEGEEKVAKITMTNENGTRILNYKLSRNGTHDDGTNFTNCFC